MFINFSNHPSAKWEQKQLSAAKKYGTVEDVPFPKVDPFWTTEEIQKEGRKYVGLILEKKPDIVMCQGEFNLCFYVVNELMKKGVSCVSACSERNVKETTLEDGSTYKEAVFNFSGFRKYCNN